MKDDIEYIDVTEHRAMIYLPENAVAVTINCQIYDPEKKDLVKCTKELSISEIREAFRKADDGYIDEDDRFTITEKGLAWLEEQSKQ